jgi:phage terminase Nu1 subunit (DNA packaging protein)
MTDVLQRTMSHADFAQIIGVSRQKVDQLVLSSVIFDGEVAGVWIQKYCSRLREQAAGRASENDEGLDLVTERAKLAAAQREGHEIKNSVARGEYAPIALLSEVLANASQSVSDRFDALPGLLKKTAPDLPVAAIEQIQTLIAQARNEWVRATTALAPVEYVSTPDTDELFEGSFE